MLNKIFVEPFETIYNKTGSTNDDRTCQGIIKFMAFLKTLTLYIIFLHSTHTHNFDMHRPHLVLPQTHYTENNIAKQKCEM